MAAVVLFTSCRLGLIALLATWPSAFWYSTLTRVGVCTVTAKVWVVVPQSLVAVAVTTVVPVAKT